MWVRKMITLFILYIMTLIFFDLIVLEWMYINWIILIIVLSIIIWEKLFLRFIIWKHIVFDDFINLWNEYFFMDEYDKQRILLRIGILIFLYILSEII